MAFNLKDWLTGLAATGELTPENVTLMEGILGKPKVVEIIQQLQEGGLRQSDYDRKMNELKTEHQKEMLRLKGVETGLTTWQTGAQAKIDEAVRKYQAEMTTRAQYEAALNRVATDYGLDVTTLMPTAAATSSPSPAPVRTDPATPQNNDEIKKMQEQLRQTGQVLPFLAAELNDLGVEHASLFGGPLTNSVDLVKKAVEENKTVRAVWEDTFKVSEKRQQVATEQAAKHDAEIRADERKRTISEMSVPTFQAGSPASPVLAAFPAKNLGQSKTGEMSSIDKAVADFENRRLSGNSTA